MGWSGYLSRALRFTCGECKPYTLGFCGVGGGKLGWGLSISLNFTCGMVKGFVEVEWG